MHAKTELWSGDPQNREQQQTLHKIYPRPLLLEMLGYAALEYTYLAFPVSGSWSSK